ncbi:MAG: PmoA family protein [Armatimonadota bacterium]
MHELVVKLEVDDPCPVTPVTCEVALTEGVSPEMLVMEDLDSGDLVACQWEGTGGQMRVTWLAGGWEGRRTAEYRIRPGAPVVPSGVELVDAVPWQLGFLVLGRPFTTYNFSPEYARPFFHPVFSPGGRRVTRNYPMLEVPGETRDHVHHRSLWVAHGDVNGADCWSEEAGHGWIRHEEFLSTFSGPVFGGFVERNVWLAGDGTTRLMDEVRSFRVYAVPEGPRIADVVVTFCASAGELRLGDTKEGGIVSVRVATSMDGDKGGTIRISTGGRGERECWGRRADWCSYTGPVDSATAGIAILDHPANPRHPTYWHVRDYGLMTANPFGVSYFEDDRTKDGSLTIPAGSEATFRYRLVIHEGDADAADIAGHYRAYASPPRASVLG